MVVFSVTPLKCVSLNNQECKIRPEVVDVNSDETVFFPYRILVKRCGRSYKNINDLYAILCVTDVIKNMNVKMFNIMSRTNKTIHI